MCPSWLLGLRRSLPGGSCLWEGRQLPSKGWPVFGVLAWSVCRPQGDVGHLLEENKRNTVRGSKGWVSYGRGKQRYAGCREHHSSQRGRPRPSGPQSASP